MSVITAARPPRRSLAQDLLVLMDERIRTGHYALGGRMPTESELMLEHGVSRTVVRETLSRLQQAGLVITRHGIGSFVTEELPRDTGFNISPAEIETILDVLHLLELRASLETETAGLAAARRTDAQVAQMYQALKEFEESARGDVDTVDADFKFHLAIAEATQNPHFYSLMRHLGTTVIPRARLNSPKIVMEDKLAYLERVNREHREICDAIARGDTESARAAMRLHLINSRERLRRAAEADAAAASATK
ncbi:MAG: FadR family transcriptional regulator [Betaproteobacteria bacterium]|nr:MAG: FadR family transcriptional regulator [Betaproteobacteria bacterium]